MKNGMKNVDISFGTHPRTPRKACAASKSPTTILKADTGIMPSSHTFAFPPSRPLGCILGFRACHTLLTTSLSCTK